MTLQDLKIAVQRYFTPEQVKENFGKLTLKSTWQSAYERCSEFIAAAADEVPAVVEQAEAMILDTIWCIAWLIGFITALWNHFESPVEIDWVSRLAACDRALTLRDSRLSSTVSLITI